jgi:hypothetical protein
MVMIKERYVLKRMIKKRGYAAIKAKSKPLMITHVKTVISKTIVLAAAQPSPTISEGVYKEQGD